MSLLSLVQECQDDPQILSTVPILMLHAHSSCNCRCIMCDIWKTRDQKKIGVREIEPQLESIRRLGVRWVVFSGGEPLMNSELPELCVAPASGRHSVDALEHRTASQKMRRRCSTRILTMSSYRWMARGKSMMVYVACPERLTYSGKVSARSEKYALIFKSQRVPRFKKLITVI